MHDLMRTLLTRRDQAVEAAGRAQTELIDLLEKADGSHLAGAIAEMLERRLYAGWWTALIEHIEDAGIEPGAALANARITAHDVLLVLPIPRSDCPYRTAEALTSVEAARAFLHDTAGLQPVKPSTPTSR